MARLFSNYPKLTRKSRDGMGVVIWWYENDWRIRRSPDRPHTYTVESALSGQEPYKCAGDFDSLATARWIIRRGPVDKHQAEVESSAVVAAMDGFTRSYLEAAQFCGVERKDNDPLRDCDKLYDAPAEQFTVETLNEMIADCARFQAEAREIILAAAETGKVHFGPDCADQFDRAGHDFWMTRNGHGVGFWDGDWPEPMATQLTDMAHKYGEVDLYMGDDDRIAAM